MTPLAFHPQGDLPQLADGVETVVLTWHTGRQLALPGAIRTAVRRRQEIESGGRAAIAQTLWHLPAAGLPAPPALGMLITDAAGDNWIAVEVTLAAGASRWAVAARHAAIQGRLADRIHLQTATLSKDDHGGQLAAWHMLSANVPARVQPLEASLRGPSSRGPNSRGPNSHGSQNAASEGSAADGHARRPQYQVILPPLLACAEALRQRPLRVVQPQRGRSLDVTAIETPEPLAGFLVMTAEEV